MGRFLSDRIDAKRFGVRGFLFTMVAAVAVIRRKGVNLFQKRRGNERGSRA